MQYNPSYQLEIFKKKKKFQKLTPGPKNPASEYIKG